MPASGSTRLIVGERLLSGRVMIGGRLPSNLRRDAGRPMILIECRHGIADCMAAMAPTSRRHIRSRRCASGKIALPMSCVMVLLGGYDAFGGNRGISAQDNR